MPELRRQLAIITFVLCPTLVAIAQQTTPTPQPAGEPVSTTFEVIVTGSNIPTAEEVGPQPVDTYRKSDIFRLGAQSATDFVQKLPTISGIAINENLNADGDGHVEIDLRGIGPRETLVLQDGRRLAPVGFASEIGFSGATVDLNMIPLGLIDHIDILKDGASSIYGSDAVAGVVNVWLIHKFRGLEIYASYGNTNLGASNDQGEELAYLLAGTGDDNTDIVVYAEAYNRAAIYSRDRDLSSNSDFTRFAGDDDNRSPDFAGRVGDFVYQPRLNRGGGSPTSHAFPNAESNPQYVPLSSLPPAQQAFNQAAFTPAVAPVDREYFYGALDRKICDQYLEVFADFKCVRGFWDSGFEPVQFSADVFTDAKHPSGISSEGFSVPLQNPFNPFTVPDYTSPGGTNPKFPGTHISAVPPGTPLTTGVHYAALEAGSRTDKVTAHNYEFTGGLKGNLGEFGDYFKAWQWESGLRYNEDNRAQVQGGIVDNNALRAALLDTNPATAFNPFGLNQNSPAALGRVFVTGHRAGKSSLMLEDLKLTGDLFSLPAGPFSFAIGGEHRTDHISDQPDALLASGQTTGTAAFQSDFFPINRNLPAKGSRDIWSLYWEVLLPVTSPLWNCFGFYSLEIGYQERFDNYSDFGSTERPKFFVRWQPFDSSVTLRATANEAYRAPTLGELFTSQTRTSVLAQDIDPAGLTPPASAIKETIGGNPNLTPEVAYEWTYGVVWTPAKLIKGLTLSADFYHIDLRNAVFIFDDSETLVTNFITRTGTLPNGAPTGGVYSDLIRRDPVTGAIQDITLTPQNQNRIITEGLDYQAFYQLDTSIFGGGDFGTFTFTFNGNYLARWRHKPIPGENKISTDGQYIGPRRGALAKDRWFTSLFYDLGGLDAGATVHFMGQMYDKNLGAPTIAEQRTRKIREWTTLDLIINYTFNLPQPITGQVPGYVMDRDKSAQMKDSKGKNVSPVSSTEYNRCGWRAWLNNTTITLGMNNVFDQDPPFVLASGENGYDEWNANIRGRIWYAALKKQF